MKLRTRLDVFSAALLSALGASQIVACGGSSFSGDSNGGASPGGHGGDGAAGSGTAGSGVSGSSSGGSNSAGAGTAGSSTGGTGGSPNKYPCLHPMDLGGGLFSCDGFIHRETSGTCSTKVPRPEPYPSTTPTAQCKYDADCTDKPYGWCGAAGQIPGPICEYGCVKDNDCGANQVCDCGDPIGQCVTASCKTDADCGGGFLCKGYDSSGGCNFTTFTCQSAGDTCGGDSDCKTTTGIEQCRYDMTAAHFSCQPGGCAIGRPFLVEGAPRLAPSARRADWSELALLPRLEALDAQLATELAHEWTRVALMEHASIAAFARFSLQLLSLGAPPELVERATSAMADETKHAKACFAVASVFAANPVGPGLLGIDDSLSGTTLEDIVLNTIREGCIGETIAAVEAREAAEHTADPALKQLLFVISEDETKHAELAFRFVQWALTLGNAQLEAAVRREFSVLHCEQNRGFDSAGSAHDARLLQHGIVPQALRQGIRAQAIAGVVLPCARALFDSDPPAQAEHQASVVVSTSVQSTSVV